MISIRIRSGLKNGDPEAFREVFRLLYPRLKGYCKLFIFEESIVEDIIQDTFLALWEKRRTIDPLKSIESLIFVMVRNRCLNYLKSSQLESGRVRIDDIQISELQYLYQLDLTGKEEKSMEEMLIESFQREVEKLPPKMKAVFIKCKIEGRKQKEVAEELGISLKMVEKHISKAKEQIKAKLFKQYPLLVALVVMLVE
jgi:RNA polymerase sigma-70 factor, ECF subfamily